MATILQNIFLQENFGFGFDFHRSLFQTQKGHEFQSRFIHCTREM